MDKRFDLQASMWMELRSLMLIIHRMNHCWHQEENRASERPNPATFLQSQILMFLYANQNQPIYQKDIEKEFDIRKPTVTKILQSMEKNELIQRKSAEHDARLKQIMLTDKGIENQVVFQKRAQEFDAIMSEDLSQEEIESLIHIIEKIKNTFMKKMDGNSKNERKEYCK